MSEIDPQIDELYQLPLGDFTAARNALAKTLKGADAARVKALLKPTVVPWAVNQLYWHKRLAYDRLVAAGSAVREAQIAALGGRGGALGRVNDAHGKALEDAVRDAVGLASAHRIKPAADQLARMLEMLSLRAGSVETPGRYTELIQAAGLEALAGIPLAEAAHKVGEPSASANSGERPTKTNRRPLTIVPNPSADSRRAVEAAAARRRATENVKAAVHALDQARSREEAAQRDVAAAQQALERTQLALEAARRERRAANGALLAAKALT